MQDGNSEAVVCWDAATGLELWRFSYPSTYRHAYGSGPRSTPTVEGGHVYTIGATGIFLASDGAAAITGQVIYVDCGYQIMGM